MATQDQPTAETDRGRDIAPADAARRAVMALAARAEADDLAAVRALAPAGIVDLRAPEVGLVMLRGRMGGTGAPFNLGEATVARAAVRLPSGTVGFAHRLGRDGRAARDAAVLDALWQEGGDTRAALDARVLAPLAARLEAEDAARAAAVAGTRVDFFTMVRGEDR
jgi:alpha-D-ribose 1-methylphosphonate 5-triphosphate synthase subunit PhnG